MTAITATLLERSALPELPARDMEPSGLVFSGSLHVIVIAAILLGLPTLFHHPPPEETPIAVQLVTLAPDTRATLPNPYKPKAEAKPEAPVAPPAPAPKPEPKPEPPPPAPPPSASVTPPLPPPVAKPEPKPEPAPPPPPPKPVEAQAPPPPPLPRPPAAKPKPEMHVAQHMPHPEPVKKPDPAAFDKLLKKLEDKKAPPQPANFDALLKNLAKNQPAETEEPPKPRQQRTAALSPPSSQPKAPLGSQLTASEIDLVREQLRPCFNPPFGAKESPDLVADIQVAMNADGTVQQARVADMGRYQGDPVFRALADSGVRALRNPQCSPLRLPPDRYDLWRTFTFGVSTRDMQ